MRGKFWVIAVDFAGVALVAAMLGGATNSGLFGALVLSLPVAMAAMLIGSSMANDP